MRLSRILLPTDFSTAAAKAADVALLLTAPRGCIELVHVYLPPSLMLPDGSTFGPTAQELVSATERAEQALADAAHTLAARAADVHIERRALMGDAADEIVRLAQSGNYDAIVMGTHGRSGWRRLLLGSVAESVMRRSPIPVVSVRESPEERRGADVSALAHPPLP